MVRSILGQREADETAAVPRHEIDRLRRCHLRRDDEVALILAILVVDEDEHAAVACLVDNLLGPDEHVRGTALDQLFEAPERVGGRIPVRLAKLAEAVGMEAGGTGKTGAAHFARVDDGAQTFNEGGAHAGPISHPNVIKSRNNPVPNVRGQPSSDRDSGPARLSLHSVVCPTSDRRGSCDAPYGG